MRQFVKVGYLGAVGFKCLKFSTFVVLTLLNPKKLQDKHTVVHFEPDCKIKAPWGH